MGGLVRKKEEPAKKVSEKKPQEKKTVKVVTKVLKKVQPKKPVEDEAEDTDESEDIDVRKLAKKASKKTIVPAVALPSKVQKESIGITGTGVIATEFRKICRDNGINMSFELCKMIAAYNKTKNG